MLTIFIPGLPFMVLLALQNNPNSRLSNRLQAHRRTVLMGYVISSATALLLSATVLSANQIWTFVKYATVPSLLFAGAVLYPYIGMNWGRGRKS